MAGTIVTDRIESDATYDSKIDIASPIVMTNGAISGNVNFDSGTLFVDSINDRIGMGTTSPTSSLYILRNTGNTGVTLESSGSGGQLAIIEATRSGPLTISSESNVGAISLKTGTSGTTERMRIDSNGRVTMPHQPAFRATSNGGINPSLTSGTLFTVLFNATETNVGNHYNTANGRFTAPVTGFYTFSASLLINQGGANRIDISFTKNGTTWIDYEFRDMGATATNASVAISTQGMLSVNDYINVRVQLVGANGNIYHEPRFWNFSGALLG
jgi:hypothetical protein